MSCELNRVAACVLTFQRPRGLRSTLNAIERLEFDGALRVVVVENEAEGPGASVCSEITTSYRWPLEFHRQPVRGIPQARNEAIRKAWGASEAIVFVDDDVQPDTRWLTELVKVQARHNAAVVTGPALPLFAHTPPEWVLQGRFFEPARYPTGTRLQTAFTNNVLVTKDTLLATEPWFDESMPLSGGTDVKYFRRVADLGMSIVWANDAVVHELIPESRMCVRWLCRRSFRIALIRTGFRRASEPTHVAALMATRSIATALWRSLCAGGRSAISGRAAAVEALRWAAYAAGVLANYGGSQFEEYREIHGA